MFFEASPLVVFPPMPEEPLTADQPLPAPPLEAAEPRPWKTAFLLAGPLLLLLLLIMLPLIRGTETLILRDVLNSHFPMKWSQAVAMRQGYFPLIDPYRAGGQPLAGNLNAAPFYPDNLLFLAGKIFWAFNAHFWIHLFLAPFAFFWMARAWGLRREAAWAAAACWTLSGFFLSHLNFYNLIAGASLAPALVAAGLDFVRRPARRPCWPPDRRPLDAADPRRRSADGPPRLPAHRRRRGARLAAAAGRVGPVGLERISRSWPPPSSPVAWWRSPRSSNSCASIRCRCAATWATPRSR